MDVRICITSCNIVRCLTEVMRVFDVVADHDLNAMRPARPRRRPRPAFLRKLEPVLSEEESPILYWFRVTPPRRCVAHSRQLLFPHSNRTH